MVRPQLKKNFNKVYNLETKKKGEVVDHLSSQFTVQYEDNTFDFLFYKDEGVTWSPAGYCYCSIGAGGKPCVSRAYCDKRRGYDWPI